MDPGGTFGDGGSVPFEMEPINKSTKGVGTISKEFVKGVGQNCKCRKVGTLVLFVFD